MQQQQQEQRGTTAVQAFPTEEKPQKASKRFSKYIYCLPEPIKNDVLENSEYYTKWMIRNLTNAVQLRDEVILSNTCQTLDTYYDLMKFSPEERVSMIKLCLQLLNESSSILLCTNACDVLIRFLDGFKSWKKDVMFPDLVIDWEPLFDLFMGLNFRGKRSGSISINGDLSQKLSVVIDIAKYFFPMGSTAKILERIRSMYSFASSSAYKAQGLMCLFLPVDTDEYKLWFDDVIKMLPWFSHSEQWNSSWLGILFRLSDDQPGKIDWSPYLDTIFTLMTRFLNLPVGRNRVDINVLSKFTNEDFGEIFLGDTDPCLKIYAQVSGLIVNSLDPEGKCQEKLTKFLKNIDIYFHPSNIGDWCGNLSAFLTFLSRFFSCRLRMERKGKLFPENFRLSQKNIDDFVTSMMDVVKLSIFTKSAPMFKAVELSVKDLAHIRPELVIPPLMEYIIPGLETVTETHQTSHAINILTCIGNILATKDKYPDGAKYLNSILPRIIPGIDINDSTKTILSLKFIMSILQAVYLNEIDINVYDMGNDKDKEWIELTKLFEDWTMQLLDKVFYIYTSKTKSSADGKEKSSLAIPFFIKTLFMGMGERIYDLSLEKVFKFVTTNMLPDSSTQISYLVHYACLPHPEKSVHLFVDYCLKKLIAPNGTPIKLSKEETLWYIEIAIGATKTMGRALVPLKEKLVSIAIAGFANEDIRCTNCAGYFVCEVLAALGSLYPLDTRSFTEDDMASPDFARSHYKYWGKLYNTKTAKIAWHIPTEEEVETAGEIFNLFVTSSMTQLDEVLSGKYDDMPSPVTSFPTMGSEPSSPTLPYVKKSSHLTSLSTTSQSKASGTGLRSMFGSSFAYATPKRFQVAKKVQESTTEGEAEAPQKKIIKVEKSSTHKASMSAISVQALKKGPMRMSLKGIIVNLICRMYFALQGFGPFFTNEFMSKERYVKELSAEASSKDWRSQWILSPPFPDVSMLFKRPKSVTVTPKEVQDFIHNTFLKITDEKTSKYAESHKVLAALAQLISAFLVPHEDRDDETASGRSLVEDLSDYAKDPLRRSKEIYLRAGIVEKVTSKLQRMMSTAWNNSPFTKTHDVMIKDLIFLLLNQFQEVSDYAGRFLDLSFQRFPYQSRNYFDEILDALTDPNAPKCKIEGALSIIGSDEVSFKLISHPQYLCKYLQKTLYSLSIQTEELQDVLYALYKDIIGDYMDLSIVPQHCIPNERVNGFVPQFPDENIGPKLSDEVIQAINDKKDEETRYKMDTLDETLDMLNETYTKVTIPKVFLPIVPVSLIIFSTIRGYPPSKTTVDIALKCSTSDLPDVNSTGWTLLYQVTFLLKAITKEMREQSSEQNYKPQFRHMTREELDTDYYALPVPATEKEWNETVFVDKSWDGWNGIKCTGKGSKRKFYALPPKSPENDPGAVLKYLTDKLQKSGFPTALKKTILGLKKESSKFSSLQAQFWKSLSELAQKSIFDEMKPVICELISDTSSSSNKVLASEAFAGIVRGSKNWPLEMQKKMWEEALQILELLTKEGSIALSNNWIAALSFISYHRDPRRLHWVTDWAVEKLKAMATEDVMTPEHSKCISIISRLSKSMNWKIKSLSESLIQLFEPIMTKSYEQAGKNISVSIHDIFVKTWRRDIVFAEDSNTWVMGYQPVISEVQKGFLSRLLKSPNFDGLNLMTPESLGDPKFQPYLNFTNTFISFVSRFGKDSTIVSNEIYEFLIESLRILFSLQIHPSEQIKGSSLKALRILAYKQFPERYIRDVVNVICDSLDIKQWHIKVAVLPFLEVFIYQNSFRMPKDLQERLVEKLVTLLGDPQIEVSSSASITLAGVLKIVDNTYTEKCCNMFMELAETKLPKKSEATDTDYSELLRKRHSGIFGLSSILGAHTYDIPPWMPNMLLKFASHMSDPEPIRNTVKTSMMEFWRTHSDMWNAEFSRMFTSDQINELRQLLVAPSYYA